MVQLSSSNYPELVLMTLTLQGQPSSRERKIPVLNRIENGPLVVLAALLAIRMARGKVDTSPEVAEAR